ncbi:MAG: DUF2007 domain-containing protein [Cyclobacteriaceae bacterium]
MNLITLRAFDNSIDAHLLKSRLESEGVISVLFDENVVGLNPLYNISVGGIKLKVRDEDKVKALQIMSEIEGTPYLDGEDRILKCPNCHSQKLYGGFRSMKGLTGILAAVVSFLMTVWPFYYKTLYKCKKCGYEFDND